MGRLIPPQSWWLSELLWSEICSLASSLLHFSSSREQGDGASLLCSGNDSDGDLFFPSKTWESQCVTQVYPALPWCRIRGVGSLSVARRNSRLLLSSLSQDRGSLKKGTAVTKESGPLVLPPPPHTPSSFPVSLLGIVICPKMRIPREKCPKIRIQCTACTRRNCVTACVVTESQQQLGWKRPLGSLDPSCDWTPPCHPARGTTSSLSLNLQGQWLPGQCVPMSNQPFCLS